jgi:hypothetical protein
MCSSVGHSAGYAQFALAESHSAYSRTLRPADGRRPADLNYFGGNLQMLSRNRDCPRLGVRFLWLMPGRFWYGPALPRRREKFPVHPVAQDVRVGGALASSRSRRRSKWLVVGGLLAARSIRVADRHRLAELDGDRHVTREIGRTDECLESQRPTPPNHRRSD